MPVEPIPSLKMASYYYSEIRWRPTQLETKDRFRSSKTPIVTVVNASLWLPTERSTKRRTPRIRLWVAVTFPSSGASQFKKVWADIDKVHEWMEIPIAYAPEARIFEEDRQNLLVEIDQLLEGNGVKTTYELGAFYAANWEEEYPPGHLSLSELAADPQRIVGYRSGCSGERNRTDADGGLHGSRGSGYLSCRSIVPNSGRGAASRLDLGGVLGSRERRLHHHAGRSDRRVPKKRRLTRL